MKKGTKSEKYSIQALRRAGVIRSHVSNPYLHLNTRTKVQAYLGYLINECNYNDNIDIDKAKILLACSKVLLDSFNDTQDSTEQVQITYTNGWIEKQDGYKKAITE